MALDRILSSLESEANLHFFGRIVLHRVLSGYLVSRLLLVEYRRRYAEVLAAPLRAPLIVLGLARSGTTLLHRLLALDPANQALPFWMLMRPFPEEGIQMDLEDDRFRRLESKLRFQRWLTPGLDARHHTRAALPEECMWMLGLTFLSPVFWIFAPVYSYVDWYLEQDRLTKYRDYENILHFYQRTWPTKRLTLKAPSHTGALREILQVLPGARIVQTHRDPVTCVTSLNSLLYSNYHAVTDRLDVQRMARTNLRLFSTEAHRNLEERKLRPESVCDVFYDRLVSDPVAVVRDIYRHFNLEWSAAFEQTLAGYVRENPKGKFGPHRYHPAEFGQKPEEIRTAFDEYIQYFDL